MTPFHVGRDVRPHEAREKTAAPPWCDADPSCAPADDLTYYLRRLYLPLQRASGVAIVATADTTAENIAWLRAAYGQVRFVEVPRAELVEEIGRRFHRRLTDEAIFSLARERPSLSAQRVVTRSQAVALLSCTGLVAAAAWCAPIKVLEVLVVAMSLFFVVSVLFRAVLVWAGSLPAEQAGAPVLGGDRNLPRYTILVPLYREARVLPTLIGSLRALDYPKDKLQVLLVVEDDDVETAHAAQGYAGEAPFEVVRVPASLPRTKPKAANFALRYATGEYIVIYDAEDRPEPDQLRKAVAAFRRHPRTVACLQARLAFHNARCWLTQSFALDYGLWFNCLLPGLDRIAAPTPLGGTSNHFRTSVLRAIHAWDPFNVTEDADIGIRLAALGYRVAMLDSTTFEEAPIHVNAWIKQRSRWLKGYMQTWLVHGRSAGSLIGQVGLGGFLAFQLFIGGAILSALINPILWAIFAISWVVPIPVFDDPSGQTLTDISALGAVGSNALLTYLATFGARPRGEVKLAPCAYTVTIYWLLISVAAYRGLWHLIVKPFHWEKTAHGLSDPTEKFGHA